MNHEKIAKEILAKLKDKSIKGHIHCHAKSGSVYVVFENSKLGKLRIGDHSERKKYGYRWNIRIDITEYYVDGSKGHNQYFYPLSQIDRLVDHIFNYNRKITFIPQSSPACSADNS